MPGRHPPHRFAGAQDAAGDVDRHDALDARRAHVLDAGGDVHHARVVDEPTEQPEAVSDLEQVDDVGFHADVATHCLDLAARRLDQADNLASRRLVRRVTDADAIAALGDRKRGGTADAAAAAGDDGDAISHEGCSDETGIDIDGVIRITDRARAAPDPPGSP